MEKIKEYKYIILILLAVLGLAFYWYEYRPSQIKKECYEVAKQQAKVNYLLSDEGIKEAQERYLLEEKAEEIGLPKLPKLSLEELYLEYGFEDNYKNCLRKKGL